MPERQRERSRPRGGCELFLCCEKVRPHTGVSTAFDQTTPRAHRSHSSAQLRTKWLRREIQRGPLPDQLQRRLRPRHALLQIALQGVRRPPAFPDGHIASPHRRAASTPAPPASAPRSPPARASRRPASARLADDPERERGICRELGHSSKRGVQTTSSCRTAGADHVSHNWLRCAGGVGEDGMRT